MPRLRFHPSGRSVEMARGATLLEGIAAADLPLARACRGSGLCGRCGVAVRAGGDQISPERGEESRAKRRNRVPEHWRLACQARLLGDAAIAASAW